jgi:hypothetical protein
VYPGFAVDPVARRSVRAAEEVRAMAVTNTLDLDAIRSGYERRDPDAILALYGENAEVRIVDQEHPPSDPMVISGHDQIAAYLRDICSRDLTHEFSDELLGDHRAAMTVRCRYADGMRVHAVETFEVDDDGHIVRETVVQAWDPA